MKRGIWVSLGVLGFSSLAWGQTPSPASTPEVPPASTAVPDAGAAPSMLDEIDEAAGAPVESRPSQTPSQLTAPTPAAPASNLGARTFQSLNPDISVILDATGGYSDKPHYSLAGDDPDLKGGSKNHPAGFTVQEAEVGFQSVVDPYFRADMFLTIPNLEGLEVEEAFVTTTSLPENLQVKAGIFRSAFGRQNGQHLHLQDFTRRPLVNAAYLGTDGLRSPGVQVSWLAPTPFFLSLTGEAFSVAPPDEPLAKTTFGGGNRTDLTYTLEAKTFIPATETLSIYGGLNAAFGRAVLGSGASFEPTGVKILLRDRASQLYAADLYVKYKPPNVTGGYFSLAWQSEFFLRRLTGFECLRDDGTCSNFSPQNEQTDTDGGFYTQVVAQFARRWYLGVREDLLGVPTSNIQPRVNRVSASLTFASSEFARLRAYAEREDVTLETGGPFNPSTTETNYAGFLQLEISMGAHGAHPF